MWLVPRGTVKINQSAKPLPEAVRAALDDWYSGKGSLRDEEAAVTLAQQARKHRYWLACSCRGDGTKLRAPMLTFNFLSEAETYYLRRLTGRKHSAHAETCTYYREQAPPRLREIESNRKAITPTDGYFAILHPDAVQLSQKPEDEDIDDRTRHKTTPKLARMLWQLLTISGLTRIPTREHDIAEIFKVIKTAAQKVEIAPGIQLAELLFTHPAAYHSRKIYAVLRSRAKTWPRDHQPQAFMLTYGQAKRSNSLQFRTEEPMPIINRIQSRSTVDNRLDGPWLALTVIGDYPDIHGYAPMRCYAEAIMSGHYFVPALRNSDRPIFMQLLAARQMLLDDDIEMQIERPLFDRPVEKGYTRPDYDLEFFDLNTGELKRAALLVDAQDDIFVKNRDELLRPHVQCLHISANDPNSGEKLQRLLREYLQLC